MSPGDETAGERLGGEREWLSQQHGEPGNPGGEELALLTSQRAFWVRPDFC